MSALVCLSPYRKISPAMWNTYIGEAIQSGNHKKYCMEHNLSYIKLYKQSIDKENWSPNSKRRYSHILWNTICYTAHSITNLNCIDN